MAGPARSTILKVAGILFGFAVACCFIALLSKEPDWGVDGVAHGPPQSQLLTFFDAHPILIVCTALIAAAALIVYILQGRNSSSE